jgi:hypothetical protein
VNLLCQPLLTHAWPQQTYPTASSNAELVWQGTQVLEDLQQAAVWQVAQPCPVVMLRHAASASESN